MPRIYDYSHDDAKSEKNYIWSVFREQRRGLGEITTLDLWGPRGILLMDGPRHQFELKTPEGTSPYRNELVDPIYQWLEENTTGPWHWIEGEMNNNRSVYTNVYLRNDADITAFQQAYGHLFSYDPDQTAENAEWVEKEKLAEEGNVLPWYVKPSLMKTAVMSIGDGRGTPEWLENLMGREGFDEAFATGLTLAIDALLKAEPRDEYGARFTDGSWHPSILEGVAALGEWIRESASPSLIERLDGFTVDDSALAEALGAISDETRLEAKS